MFSVCCERVISIFLAVARSTYRHYDWTKSIYIYIYISNMSKRYTRSIPARANVTQEAFLLEIHVEKIYRCIDVVPEAYDVVTPVSIDFRQCQACYIDGQPSTSLTTTSYLYIYIYIFRSTDYHFLR
jgi:hypothetical protein